MGGHNGTCAISHLPILKGEPTRLVLIQQSLYPDISGNEGRDMMGGVSTLWRPRCIPILGKYDGYGRVGEIDDDHWATQLALARFRLDLVEREVGTRNEIHEPAVVLDEVLNGGKRAWTNGPKAGIEWLQRLIHDDRVLALVPAWLDCEEDRTKHVTSCLVREDIYQALANHITDDNHGHGRRPEFTREQIEKDVLGRAVVDRLLGDPGMDAFIKPRTPGSGLKLMEDTRKLFEELGKDDELRGLGDSIESGVLHRMRDSADRFAVDYARHLMTGGVESEDPVITSIISEVAAFTHVEIHMALMSKFWHPQDGGQAEGWLSHAAIALKTIELVKKHAQEGDT